ncbi:MAG: long-chain fatty acid--CoA ligase [Bdellovibrionaceae bacterium]|nr:long-chain fatty acid--CoA ligase [Pseudobdellovibrionaceae bacterium]
MLTIDSQSSLHLAPTSPNDIVEMDWLKKWYQYAPTKVAIQDGQTGACFTYEELYLRSCRGAAFLQKTYAIEHGDRVSVLALNDLSYVVLFFALQRLGATLVPVNYRLTSREVNHIIDDCKPKLVIRDNEFAPILNELTWHCPQLALTGIESFGAATENYPQSFLDYNATMPDTAMIIYTSGTTGAPKGAMISHQMIFWNSINTTLRLNISQNDCTVIFLPFFHTGGWNVLTTPFLHRGAKVVFLNKFDGDGILRLSQDEQATLLFGVPTTMDMMAQSPLFDAVDLSHIRYAVVGGEPMPLPLIEKWHAKGIPIRQGYGLTEFGPNVFSLNEEDAIRKIGSIGFPNFYVQTKIMDESGNELKENEIGELWLRGPMCMTGYWHNPKATASTIQDGWLATGDLVYKDAEGYHYIAGRKKDMYKSGGENVYPAELEQVLRRHPGIVEAAVIGVPDEKWGEVGKAFVVSKNKDLTSDDVREYCIKNLAKFKVPKYFEFLDTLPKGDSGKILKRALMDRALSN